MSMLEELSAAQAKLVISAAAERRVPLAVTVRCENRWVNLRSTLWAAEDERLLIEEPQPEQGAPPYEFVPGETIGLSFKLKHYKHVMTSTVEAVQPLRLDDGTVVPVLAVSCPSEVHRLQRRAYNRAAVPPNRIVRASFWLGGRQAEPSGTSPDRPVWPARVLNVSAGGCQVTTEADVANVMDVGDTVGIRIAFGPGTETFFADAQFRHAEVVSNQALLGFQFVGLAQTEEGRAALSLISNKVAEYQHMADAGKTRKAWVEDRP